MKGTASAFEEMLSYLFLNCGERGIFMNEDNNHRYGEFLQKKVIVSSPVGKEVEPEKIHPFLYDFQRDIVLWCLRKGRSAVFAHTGSGKTIIQCEFARHVGGRVIIFAPLAVNKQTIEEAKKIDLEVKPVRAKGEIEQGINITNYEMINHFIGVDVEAIVLDESSIMKDYSAKTRNILLDHFTHIPYRLCCTATPCPNDIAELANHSEFLGIMKRTDVLASFFVHDQNGWRMRGHARKAFYRWLSSWAISFSSPYDIGYDGSRFILPPLSIREHVVKTSRFISGTLFPTKLKGIQNRVAIRKSTVQERINMVMEIIIALWEAQKNTTEDIITLTEKPFFRDSMFVQQEEPMSRYRGKESTTINGTRSIKSTLKNIGMPSGNREMQGDVNYIDKTQRKPVCKLENGKRTIPNGRKIMNSEKIMGLPLLNTELFSIVKEGSVLSALEQEENFISTIATKLEQSEGSCAQSAILPSGSLKMTRKDYDELPDMSNLNQIIVWCGLNIEQNELAGLLGTKLCVSIHGGMSMDEKLFAINKWLNNDVPVLITKPKVFGHGLNFQNCSNIIFLGLNDSWESYFQAIRRCWRYGQINPVSVNIVVSDHETDILLNIKNKEKESLEMIDSLVAESREFSMVEIKGRVNVKVEEPKREVYQGKNWVLYQGDCVEELKTLADNSIDLSVYSPPFLSLYQYSATERDMGNSKNENDFFEHFGFMISDLLRVTKEGRLTCCHVSQVPAMLVRDGYIGMKDFRGRCVVEFEKRGWIYQGEVVVQKNPQIQAARVHSKGLLFNQLKKDSSWLRPALADYILVFRKPGENKIPIKPDITNDQWISWAHPVWFDIRETNTLNTMEAKADQDDRHICPLQLEVIERCIRLWSNTGETVLSPFAGIGSEGYMALKHKRKFVGVELKAIYAEVAVRNLKSVENEEQKEMFE